MRILEFSEASRHCYGRPAPQPDLDAPNRLQEAEI